VPIQRYPSAVCAIDDTEPPGNPFSVPQESRKYCETIRLGSIACAETAKHTSANPATAHLIGRRVPKAASRKVLKLLNHNLAGLLQGIFVARNHVKYQTRFRLTR